ncbi:MAG: GAF domain-containing protein, partial [Actinomycetota bacterium]|nr:GAF domain-containing protein [Actinomycetota bacterium]
MTKIRPHPAAVLFVYGLLTVGIVALTILASAAGTERPPPDIFNLAFPLVLVPYIGAGFVLARRFPSNPVGWLMSLSAVAWVLSGFAEVYGQASLSVDLPLVSLIGWFGTWPWVVAIASTGVFTILLFPDGTLPSPRWRVAIVIGIAGSALGCFSNAVVPGPMMDAGIVNPVGVDAPWVDVTAITGFALLFVGFFLSVLSLFFRMRRASGEQRQQIKWVAYVGSAIPVALFMAALGGGVTNVLPTWLGNFGWGALLLVLLIALPVSIGIAILKYRLYDIDVVINKTIVFGVLAAFITGIYVAIVVGIGTLLGSSDKPNLALSIAATAVVAIAFSPVKDKTQRLANRLVYGHRASPYEVMANLARTVAIVGAPQEVVAAVAHAAAAGVNASTRVTLHLDEGRTQSAAWPKDDESVSYDDSFAITHRGQVLGTLEVTKPRGEPLTPTDKELLADLCAQAGLGLHNARLVLELQARLVEIEAQAHDLKASRERIVSAQDDSRRALEKDITGGPQKGLETIYLKLDRALEL